MSLTEAERVFAAAHEDGLNDVLAAFFHARPRYLSYGSPGFVPVTTITDTQMPAIPFPGVPGGIDWSVRLEPPKVDLHPRTTTLPPELGFPPGGISVQTAATLCVACESRRRDEDREKEDREGRRHGEEAKGTCFRIGVAAVGGIERTTGAGGDSIRIRIDAIELVDIEPGDLEAVIECLLLQVVRAMLAQVAIPLETLRAGAFSLSLTRGPEVGDDQIKLYGMV